VARRIVTLDNAVRNSIRSGVTYVVAAGSSASDARNFSPARAVEAITTSATNINDCTHPPSNYGPAIALVAPGVNMTGPWAASDTATMTLTRTCSRHRMSSSAPGLPRRPPDRHPGPDGVGIDRPIHKGRDLQRTAGHAQPVALHAAFLRSRALGVDDD
jgi:subtilisin family serine protease